MLSSADLTPGDIVIIETGNIIPADILLIEVYSLKINESSLTDESVNVEEDPNIIVKADSPLSERINVALKGTFATHVRAKRIVTTIGMDTEFGKIADLLQESETQTPL